MPRSFLVRKYFRKKDFWNDEEESEEESDSEEKASEVKQSSQAIALTYLAWAAHFTSENGNEFSDYEAEKAYWFEASGEKNKLQSLLEAKFDTEFQKIEKTKNNIEQLENDKVTSVGIEQLEEKEVTSLNEKIEEKGKVKKVLPQATETLAWENLEEKLKQMLEEDKEIVIKNVKQFLENNRILAREIAVETGLSQDDINAYMEGNSNFDDEKRKEFYKWYLTKILRPPNGRDDSSYTCYKCGKIFAYESYLERHIKYVCPDNTGRTWKCSYCGKAFQYPCYLRRHIRSHTGESPYKCDKCDRAFVRSTDLQRHIRNHTGEKPYRCSECDRAFARSTDLKRHMRTHTGEKPYKCWQCGKTFSQSGSLQTHLHTHNKDGTGGRKQTKKPPGQ